MTKLKRLHLKRAESKTQKRFEEYKEIEEQLLKAIHESGFSLREDDKDVQDAVFYMRGSFHRPLSEKEAPNVFVEFFDAKPQMFGGLLMNFLVKNPDFVNWAAKAVQIASMEMQRANKLILPKGEPSKGRLTNLETPNNEDDGSV